MNESRFCFRGEIILSELPKLVSFSVQLCGIQETEEGSDTRYFKQLSICSKTRLKVKVLTGTNNVMNYINVL